MFRCWVFMARPSCIAPSRAGLGRSATARCWRGSPESTWSMISAAPTWRRAARVRESALPQPVVVVNIGGVAQVTYIQGDTVLAFDTGPGNAPIDDWMQRHTGKPVDEGGALAKSGTVNRAALGRMLAHDYFL